MFFIVWFMYLHFMLFKVLFMYFHYCGAWFAWLQTFKLEKKTALHSIVQNVVAFLTMSTLACAPLRLHYISICFSTFNLGPQRKSMKDCPVDLSASFCAWDVTPEGNLTRQGAPCSMQQVWEGLTGKHGCNTGDKCTQGTESHLHNKQYTMTTASGNWRKLGLKVRLKFSKEKPHVYSSLQL